MAEYTIQFPFSRHGEPYQTGDTIEVSDAQATWYEPDGRIAPVVATGTISGLVFLDDDSDTINDPSEGPFLLGLDMQITDAQSIVHTVPVSTSDGTYSASGLAVGDASVEPVIASVPSGYEVSNESLPLTVSVVANQTATAPDLGIKAAGGGGA